MDLEKLRLPKHAGQQPGTKGLAYGLVINDTAAGEEQWTLITELEHAQLYQVLLQMRRQERGEVEPS